MCDTQNKNRKEKFATHVQGKTQESRLGPWPPLSGEQLVENSLRGLMPSIVSVPVRLPTRRPWEPVGRWRAWEARLSALGCWSDPWAFFHKMWVIRITLNGL